ncbi:MAG: acyloxyacyl hydrolase [Parvibaculum sp.]|nr:acyloxyacyl hydrolase [Parvibaculum sp.]
MFGMRLAARVAVMCVALSALAVPASAGVSELRAGIYAHDLLGPALERDNADITGEIVFDSPYLLSWAFAPRPRFGGTLSGNGGTSLVYVDLGWTIALGEKWFADFSVGAAVHDGHLSGSRPYENQYGCRANFHETASIGYRMSDAWSLMLTGEHMSNASLCDENDGLSNIGLRLAYSF